MFNFRRLAVNEIFNDFDISGDQVIYLEKLSFSVFKLLKKELDYKEFKMFAMACIDRQRDLNMKIVEERKCENNFYKRNQKQKKINILLDVPGDKLDFF